MKKICLSIAVLALTAILTGSALAQVIAIPSQAVPTPTPPLEQRVDHFRCYLPLNNPVVNTNIQLIDQFDAALHSVENINQLILFRFCNPVKKQVGGVVTPMVSIKHHLTIFLINPQPIIMRTVTVRNQFGTQTLSVADARALAVPTGKAIYPNPAPPAPTDMDHYKCYIASGNPVNVLVTLSDQFFAESVWVTQPLAFCNPVKKIHDAITTTILNPDGHLVCYATTPSAFAGATVNISNQFGLFTLELGRPDLLCVPSLKLAWSVVATPTDPTTP
jgi:hypothetical protein